MTCGHKTLTHKKKNYLALLATAKNRKRRNLLIDYADKDDINAICECIFNVLQGNIKLPKKHKLKLAKDKACLRSLISGKMSLKKKKTSLKQKGGFLPFILPAIIGAITTGISAAIK